MKPTRIYKYFSMFITLDHVHYIPLLPLLANGDMFVRRSSQ